MEILTIFAIIIGPIAAVQIEKQLHRSRANWERKTSIFKTLMATRGAVLSYSHEKKYENVISSWKEYFDNLSQKVTDENVQVWSARNEELLSNLLFEMGNSLGYKFDKVLIKRNVYSPVAHGSIEREMQAIRKGIIDILYGDRNLPFEIIQNQDPETLDKQKQLQEAMLKYYNTNTK